MDTESPAITYRALRSDDVPAARALRDVYLAAFGKSETPPLKAYDMAALLSRPEFHCFVAMQGEKVVGGLGAHEMISFYNGGKEVFIYDIAVLPTFQRRGVGRGLVAAFRAHCQQLGIGYIFLNAQADDPDALKFYRGIQAEEEAVVQFGFSVG